MMQRRRVLCFGIMSLAAATAAPAGQALAQYYPPPPRPYGDDDEEEHRRYEERRREEEHRRHEYYEGRRNEGGGRAYELEQRRNERVLALQQQLARGEIGRRQFDYGVAEIDRELNDRLYGH